MIFVGSVRYPEQAMPMHGTGVEDESADVKVLILEDHPLYAQMLRDEIRQLVAEADCAMAHRLDEGIESIRQRMPDVVIIDLNVPGASGLRALRAVKEEVVPGRTILIVTSGESDLGVMSASWELGAAGFIPKSLPAPDQIQALSKVLAGGTFFPKVPLSGTSPKAGRALSSRNLEVLALAARGQSIKQIASAMQISERQVKRHFQEISERLGTRGSRYAILAAARAQGLVR
jgi:DNA-binding NarL/FixJ family response regulator